MAVVPTICPVCQSRELTHLHRLSAEAWVDYFRCVRCGHIVAEPKPDPLPPPAPASDDDSDAGA